MQQSQGQIACCVSFITAILLLEMTSPGGVTFLVLALQFREGAILCAIAPNSHPCTVVQSSNAEVLWYDKKIFLRPLLYAVSTTCHHILL